MSKLIHRHERRIRDLEKVVAQLLNFCMAVAREIQTENQNAPGTEVAPEALVNPDVAEELEAGESATGEPGRG